VASCAAMLHTYFSNVLFTPWSTYAFISYTDVLLQSEGTANMILQEVRIFSVVEDYIYFKSSQVLVGK
jgi:hypothetical protein